MRSLPVSLLSILLGAPAWAQAPALSNSVRGEIAATRIVEMEVGQSRILQMANAIGRVSVANPDVADVKVITPTEIQITASKVGTTHLSVWDKSDRAYVMDVRVTRNLEDLRKQLKDLFPGESIDVTAAGDLVVLSGEVGDVRLPQRAVEVAQLTSERVANLIRVRGNQQVQLEVRFAEVSRSGLREMGLNFFYQDPRRIGGMFSPETSTGQFIPREPQNQPPFMPGTGSQPGSEVIPHGLPGVQQGPFTGSFNLFFSNRPGFPFSAMLSLLVQNGLAKTLAEPTLVAMSGQEAKFLAGGELPIPFVSGLGNVTVEWKKFGIQLVFTPTVIADDTIHLKMATEVSEPDPLLAVSIGGFTIPGLQSRQSETTVRLKDGQSFAIAGLLSDKTRSLVKKVPLLGDIPILGALFRSTNYQREETELLVVVTTRLVRPLAPHEVPPMPGDDEVNDPDDFELFMLGRLSRGWGESDGGQNASARRGPSGEVGFGK
jgi:pilus assembly protein CpaC